MRILLDTHIVLWWLADDPRLSPAARAVISDAATDVHVSAISVAEIAIKSSLGKLTVRADLGEALGAAGFSPLPFDGRHALRLTDLPWHHRDPFDRMLIAQASVEGLVFASADPACARYQVEILS